MSVEFPLNEIRTELGIVADPTIPVNVFTTAGWRLFAKLVGVELSSCRKIRSYGIDGMMR